MSSAHFSYDAIAEVYATDMGRSMPFDDVGWYRRQCLTRGGRALELGCGTGRILLELLAAGVDAIGVDRSLPMLRRLRRDGIARGIEARVAQMDLRELALTGRFAVILAPYSLITYLIDPVVAVSVLEQLRALLARDGRLVLDAFIPRPVESFTEYSLDYRRPHGEEVLERHKRITANADGTNRIERRYRLYTAEGRMRDEFHTDETIRPYTPGALAALADTADLRVENWVFDYGTGEAGANPRFATALLGAA
ncbi:MAG TPA: class I SAM-dependent methyltransferase [Rhodanobacteraceae bacterium]|jgi:SAM-dependent methyltransferase|nr:class I SAM-dependent methyltransferase [Rhodanobacteraceae bacterium]